MLPVDVALVRSVVVIFVAGSPSASTTNRPTVSMDPLSRTRSSGRFHRRTWCFAGTSHRFEYNTSYDFEISIVSCLVMQMMAAYRGHQAVDITFIKSINGIKWVNTGVTICADSVASSITPFQSVIVERDTRDGKRL
ncbi:hypothetical protein AN958_07444 [Leucoagaricus sp. SymC.cos]|nr:hypothetical protein AN958_07444 [Leucoagaricus sp. SymC.cos]